MSRKKTHPAISILNGIYWCLRMIGLFFWWSAKFMYLGLASISESVTALTGKKTNTHTTKETEKHAKGKHDAEEKVEAVTVAPAKKQKPSAWKEPATFMPMEPVSTIKGDFMRFGEKIRNSSSIVLIAGRRGSGKSVLGFRVMENITAKTQRPAYVLGVKQSVLPKWIETVDNLEQVKNGGIVLIDEGALSFNSRDSMSKKNKALGQLLAVARHKDLTLLLITQNTGMIDKNVLNLTDTILLKEGSLLQEKMERSVMKDIYTNANNALAKIPAEERQAHVYVFDNDFEGVCKVGLPSFWNATVSKNQA